MKNGLGMSSPRDRFVHK